MTRPELVQIEKQNEKKKERESMCRVHILKSIKNYIEYCENNILCSQPKIKLFQLYI